MVRKGFRGAALIVRNQGRVTVIPVGAGILKLLKQSPPLCDSMKKHIWVKAYLCWGAVRQTSPANDTSRDHCKPKPATTKYMWDKTA